MGISSSEVNISFSSTRNSYISGGVFRCEEDDEILEISSLLLYLQEMVINIYICLPYVNTLFINTCFEITACTHVCPLFLLDPS